MSDDVQPPAQPVPEPAAVVAEQPEKVALGLLAAVVAVIAGIVLTVVIWRAGYVAAITSLVIAIGAGYLYQMAAGRPARKGLVPLIILIVLGVVLSFFAVVASDLNDAYDAAVAAGFEAPVSKATFIREGVTDPDLLKEYGKDMALFGLFAALGIFGTIRRMIAQR